MFLLACFSVELQELWSLGSLDNQQNTGPFHYIQVDALLRFSLFHCSYNLPSVKSSTQEFQC